MGNEDKSYIEEIYGHLEGILDDVDRMTSGNFMHNKYSIKFHAKMIKDVLNLMGFNYGKK